MRADNPCLTCGACCAHFRVSFHWAEAAPALNGTVPPEMTEKLDNFRVVLKGTNEKKPRCIALEGKIGECVKCTIYGNHPSPCREFEFSWQNGQPHDRCDQARAAWGLPPLHTTEVESMISEN